jgi:hypothetical protein
MTFSDSRWAVDRRDIQLESKRNDDTPPDALPTTDGAMDTMLRSVPLPAGLMTRLGRLVYTLADECANQRTTLAVKMRVPYRRWRPNARPLE